MRNTAFPFASSPSTADTCVLIVVSGLYKVRVLDIALAMLVLEVPGFAYDATKYLLPTLQAQGYTTTFVSDGDPVVPEPGTLVLFGSGLIGLAGLTRRRMSK
jgi:hypothetical protein